MATPHTITWPAGTLAGREFRANDLVLLIDRDPAVYEVMTVQSVVGDAITLTDTPRIQWGSTARIIPLRVARVDDLPSLSLLTSVAANTTVRFELDEPETAIVPDWGYCAPLWRFKTNWASSGTMGYDRTTYHLDVDTGRVEVVDPADVGRVVQKADLTLLGRNQLTAFRSFVAQARGRAVRFWWQTGTHDLEPIGTIGGARTMDVAKVGYSEWFTVPQDARRQIAIVFNDGRPSLYRQIVAVDERDTFDRLTLDTDLPVIERRQISRVSYLMPVRFDHDTFEIHHVTDDAKAVRSSVTVRSSEFDDMPPLGCFVTSQTYPIYLVDELTPSMSLVAASLTDFNVPPDGVNTSVALRDAELRNALLEYTAWAAEEISSSLALLDGSLATTLIAYENARAEAVDASMTILSGSLVVGLISYSNYAAEGINSSISIVGGTLT